MPNFRLRPPRIKLTENDVESAVTDVLRLRGLYPLRQQSGLFKTLGERFIRVGEPGIPDYCIPAFFVEVKAPGKKLSEVQRQKIQLLEEHWHLETAVIENPGELIRWLAQHHIKS